MVAEAAVDRVNAMRQQDKLNQLQHEDGDAKNDEVMNVTDPKLQNL